MRPAWSVIAFTTLSGAGYGLLGWLAVVLIVDGVATRVALAALATGAALVTAGLLSSTFHLGRPARAWRAFSQWQSSWLSREGVAALATYLPMAWLALSIWHGAPVAVTAWMLLIASVFTVICTAMIYASLRTVVDWHQPLVPVVYVALAAATGGYAFLTLQWLVAVPPGWQIQSVAGTLIAAWLIKLVYWRRCSTQNGASTPASAIGVAGQVRPLDPPHTGENYLMREMVYQVARKHAAKLRAFALLFGLGVPLLALLGAVQGTQPLVSMLLIAIGLISLLLGTAIERWLFFAQARHTVALYYGAASA